MKIKNFIFLASSHNVAKAYLAVMLELNLIPERIIFTEFVQRQNPKAAERPSMAFIKTIHHQLRSMSPVKKIRRVLGMGGTTISAPRLDEHQIYKQVADFANQSGLPVVEFFTSTEEMLRRHNLVYERHCFTSLNDPEFISLISNAPQTVALYVEGGILRKPVLSTPIRFLHIHPGVVPLVRGSAGMLWSALVHKKVGMSGFFMNEGIDTGDVILTKEYPVPKIPISAHFATSQYADARYLALEDYIGASYRADILRELLKQQPDPEQWMPQLQDRTAGKLYFHPHTKIRDQAVEKFFVGMG